MATPSREAALSLVMEQVTRRNVLYHMLAVEAIMRRAAEHFGGNPETWGLVGLLHDIDYEKTETAPEKHGLLAEKMLEGRFPQDVIRAIKTHNAKLTGVAAESPMEKALTACDAISGLLVACALVMPSKKLDDVKTETVAKKFKDKDFARGADRERILVCEKIGLPREAFFEIALEGLKSAARDIEL